MTREVFAMTNGRKILMIIAPNDFRDEELFHTREELEKAGFAITVASKSKEPATGMLGAVVTPDRTLNGIVVSDFEAVVFVGGGGAQVYFDDTDIHEIAKASARDCKVTAAICIAPSILAKSGLLNGRKATVWDDDAGTFSKLISAQGAKYTGETVTISDNIITANGPTAAHEFGKTIAKRLK